MDNQNPTGKKLAGLRTFAKDQERINHKTDSAGVGFVVSAQDSITETLSKINKTPIITETAVNKTTVIEQKLAAPKEHKEVEQDRVSPEPRAQENNEVNQTNKITSLEQELNEKKPASIPQLTRKTDADIKIHDSEEVVSGATIITDTKKGRFKLFPAISESIKDWFKELQKTREQKKKPKYTVPETTRRKGVIQKATSQTGKITTADHETLQERIKQRLEKEIVGFGNEPETNITWTPKTESVFPLLEAGSNVSILPRKNFHTTQQEIIVSDIESVTTNKDREVKIPESTTEEVVDDLNLSTDKESGSIPPKQTETENVTDEGSGFDKPETIIQTVEIPTATIFEIKEEEIKNEEETITEQKNTEEYSRESAISDKDSVSEKTPDILQRPKTLPSINTNLISLILVIIIVTLLFVTGLGENLFKNTNQPEKVGIEHLKLINSELKLIVATDTREGIENLIINENKNTSEINQFVFITNEAGQLLNPSSLMIKLGFGVSANFKQSTSHIFFGNISQTPFVAFKITDQTTAKGGMLGWEESLHNNLKNIFGLNEENSNKFIDGMIGGVDVRVLKNSNGQDEIIYGFIDSNTIIISKDSETFTILLELVRQ